MARFTKGLKMSEDPFGYVAGVEPDGEDYGHGGELETVMLGVAALMAWRTVPPFAAIVVHELGSETRRFRIDADPMRAAYALLDLQSGSVDSYDPVAGEYVIESQAVEFDHRMLTPEPSPARLAFPLSLLIWGRPQDNWRVFSGSRSRHEINLELISQIEPSVRGELRINRHSNMAVRLDTPTEKIWYETVEPRAN